MEPSVAIKNNVGKPLAFILRIQIHYGGLHKTITNWLLDFISAYKMFLVIETCIENGVSSNSLLFISDC